MKKIFASLILIISISTFITAQNENDALRYSFLLPGGTARSISMGGAFGALGADASVLSINPAGLGVYRKSEFTLSPSFVLTNSNSSYLGVNRSDYNFNFSLNNIAYVGTVYSNNDDDDYYSVSLGFAYNRLNDFNQNIAIEGRNVENSITDWFAASATGLAPEALLNHSYEQFYSALAWETYLIDNIPNSNNYSSYFNNRGQNQRELISRSGYMGEYAFSIAGNLLHKLYIGATIGVNAVKYEQNNILTEVDDEDLITGFNSLTYREYLETRGSGVNFKLGLLYRVNNWFRFGGAIHTPTFYNLNDSFYTSLSSDFSIAPNTQDSILKYQFKWSSVYGRNTYDLNTPFKAIANMAFIISKQALISIDYEYLDYTKARLRSENYSFFTENDNIREFYKPAHNVRLGAEYRYGPLSFRIGAAYYDSPFKSDNINKDFYTLIYSGGIGIRGNDMYFDIAYSYIANSEFYSLYEGFGVNSPTANLSFNQSRVVASIGFLF